MNVLETLSKLSPFARRSSLILSPTLNYLQMIPSFT